MSLSLRLVLAAVTVAGLAAVVAALADPVHRGASGAIPAAAATVAGARGTVVLAAGDIGRCDSDEDEYTARLLDRRPGTVLMLGDAAYPAGTAADFARCYAPTWGRHRSRTYAAAGNHDLRTRGAGGFFDYFSLPEGARRGAGYYSLDLGGWHVVALDSNQPLGRGSAQHAWLASDLASRGARCTLAFFHHPRFSSGEHGNHSYLRPIWALLFAHGVEIVLSAHDHDYERFAPQTPDGRREEARGIRQFVVGTGGAPLRPFGKTKRQSEMRDATHHGVLALTLQADAYEWEFIGSADERVLDRGRSLCH